MSTIINCVGVVIPWHAEQLGPGCCVKAALQQTCIHPSLKQGRIIQKRNEVVGHYVQAGKTEVDAKYLLCLLALLCLTGGCLQHLATGSSPTTSSNTRKWLLLVQFLLSTAWLGARPLMQAPNIMQLPLVGGRIICIQGSPDTEVERAEYIVCKLERNSSCKQPYLENKFCTELT